MNKLTVEEACAVLRVLGCDSDPIWVRGVETTPAVLSESEAARLSRWSGRFLVTYFCGEKKVRKKAGTLLGMVLDRMGIKRSGS